MPADKKSNSKKVTKLSSKKDSLAEDLFELVDPTGISSYDDVKDAYNRTGLSLETGMEALGALPIIGKFGKTIKGLKVGSDIFKEAKLSKLLRYLDSGTKLDQLQDVATSSYALGGGVDKGKEFAEDRTKRGYYYYLGESNKSKLLDSLALEKSRRTPYKKGGKLEDGEKEDATSDEIINGTKIVRGFIGDSHYSPEEDTVYISAFAENEDEELDHEMYHAQQAKSGRLRLEDADPYGVARRKPSIAEEKALVDYPYYNRRVVDQQLLEKNFLHGASSGERNPSFNLVPFDLIYNNVYNPQMYNTPWMAEGEARAAETPKGRRYLAERDIAPEFYSRFYSRAEGGFLNEYLEEGDGDKKSKPTTKSGIDKELLIRQQFKESSFNPKAKSGANARGLAQIMENVEQDALKAGVLKKGEDIYDPKVNAKVQKWYMEDLYNSSFINKPGQKEDVKKAKVLASYNYGRGNILKHLNEQKAKGVDIYNSYDWLKGLPAETTDYVEKILLKKDPKFEKEYSKAVKKYSYKANGGWLDKYADGGKIKKFDPLEEKEFLKEYAKYSKQTGMSPNPDDPEHYYDYRGLWKDTGSILYNLDAEQHLPSKYKTKGHSNKYIQGVNTTKEFAKGGWLNKYM